MCDVENLMIQQQQQVKRKKNEKIGTVPQMLAGHVWGCRTGGGRSGLTT